MNKPTRLLMLAAICAAVSVSSFAVADSLAAQDPAGEAITRELPWDGSEALTIEVPASHQGSERPDTKNSVTLSPAFFVYASPIPADSTK